MGLRTFFRRHRNVFSYTTEEVDMGRGNEDMAVEEYGERAVEADQAPSAGLVRRMFRGYPLPPDVSYDEIADGEMAED
jgi:hypothetical protein